MEEGDSRQRDTGQYTHPKGKKQWLEPVFCWRASSVPKRIIEEESVLVQTETLTEPFICAGVRVLLDGEETLSG